MAPEHDPQLWLQNNPAWPAAPTLLDAKGWKRLVKTVDAPPNNAVDLLSGRDTWIGTAWEPTPWGGMERARVFNPGQDGTSRYEPIRITVLTPGEVRHGRCIPAGGEPRRVTGILLRRRVTGDLDLLRRAHPVDPHADLPGRRVPAAPTPAEQDLRQGTHRILTQRLRIRAVAGGFLGAFLEQAGTLLADWNAAGSVTLAAAAAGAIIGAGGPFVVGRAGSRLSRPLTLAGIGDDPRSLILCVLQYYLAHADQLGTRGDALILEAWRLLYHTAAVDHRSQAAMTEVWGRVDVLTDQVRAVGELLDAQTEVERAAARPRVAAIEEQEDHEAVAAIREAPDQTSISELTDELHMDAAARRSAARRLDNGP